MSFEMFASPKVCAHRIPSTLLITTLLMLASRNVEATPVCSVAQGCNSDGSYCCWSYICSDGSQGSGCGATYYASLDKNLMHTCAPRTDLSLLSMPLPLQMDKQVRNSSSPASRPSKGINSNAIVKEVSLETESM